MPALSSLFISHSSRDHTIAMEVGRRLRARHDPQLRDEIGQEGTGCSVARGRRSLPKSRATRLR
jgi:hypothetical protein